MGRKSREKGKKGEREAAAEWNRLFGTEVRRSVQFSGRSDTSDDLVGQEGVAIEVKRCEALAVYQAIERCADDAREGAVPLVLHRKNGKPWLAIVRLDDLPQLANTLFLTLAAIGKSEVSDG